MTPYEIDILLHYATCALDYPERWAPIYESTISSFLTEGLLEVGKGGTATYVPTQRLLAYRDALESVPLPEQTWVTKWPTP